MIKEKNIEITWLSSTRKRYEKLGYEFSKYGDNFLIRIEDLPKFSEKIVTTICDKCGKEKKQTYHSYNTITRNGSKKYICRDCFLKDKIIKYSDLLEDFKKSKYRLITTQEEYKNGDTIIKYMCPDHGEQTMRASNFHNGKRCKLCAIEKASKKYKFSSEEVDKLIESCGGKLYNPSDYINQDVKNLKILCPRCQINVFTTSLKHFRQHGVQSCEECRKKESVGERRVRQWLEKNEINFIQEKRFEDCRDTNPLPFDFYLPELNIAIEYDGEQHFKENHFFDHCRDLEVTKYISHHDDIKNHFCESNNISLLRIPYTQINDIERILEREIFA